MTHLTTAEESEPMPSTVRAVVAMEAGAPAEIVDIEAPGHDDDPTIAVGAPHLDGWIARGR